MKRGIVLLIVLGMMFMGCTKQADQGTPPEAEKSAVEKKAVESTKEAVPEEAAKAEEEDPDVTNCLQLVSQAKFNDALPVCLEALKKHPANDEVKAAVEKAQAAVGNAVATATETAEDAQEAAGEKAEGAMGEATGGLVP